MCRNRIDRALTSWNVGQGMPSGWSLSGCAGQLLFNSMGHSLKQARKLAKQNMSNRRPGHPRQNSAVTHDDVLAQLTFGNWTSLLGCRKNMAPSAVQNSQVLWNDALRFAFPGAFQNDNGRIYVGQRLERLRELRNRVSHHENLLEVKGKNRLMDMIAVLTALGPGHPNWALYGSRVRQVTNADPRLKWQRRHSRQTAW